MRLGCPRGSLLRPFAWMLIEPLVLVLLDLCRMVSETNRLKISRGFWNLEFHLIERIDENAGNGEIPKPFVIGWNNIPWRVRRGRLAYRIFEGRGISRPVFALGIIGIAYFPIPMRVLESFLEPGKLLFWTDVQIELEHACARLGKKFLELTDAIIAC